MRPYHFSVNGTPRKADSPSFYADSGSLRIRIVGTGVSSIKTPATEADEPFQVGPIKSGAPYYPPQFAAQMAMDRLSEMFDPSKKAPVMKSGPDLNRGLNDTLSSVAYSLGPMRAFLGNGSNSWTVPGANASNSLGGYSNRPQLNLSTVDLYTV
jgi:hypothetical protein